jgi:hypothetical protein
MIKKITNKIFRKNNLLLVAVFAFVVSIVYPSVVSAYMTPQQRRGYDSGAIYYDYQDLNVGAFLDYAGLGCLTLAAPDVLDQEALIEAMDQFIYDNTSSERRSNSPFRGLGRDLVIGSLMAEGGPINPFFVLAIAMKETEFGTTGYYNPEAQNAFGRTTDDPDNIDHVVGRGSGSGDGNTRTVYWYKYGSWALSLNGGGRDDQPTFLARRYLAEGLVTPEQVIAVYAPESDGNDVQLYVSQITQWMNLMVQAAGGAVSCEVGTADSAPGDETTDPEDEN